MKSSLCRGTQYLQCRPTQLSRRQLFPAFSFPILAKRLSRRDISSFTLSPPRRTIKTRRTCYTYSRMKKPFNNPFRKSQPVAPFFLSRARTLLSNSIICAPRARCTRPPLAPASHHGGQVRIPEPGIIQYTSKPFRPSQTRKVQAGKFANSVLSWRFGHWTDKKRRGRSSISLYIKIVAAKLNSGEIGKQVTVCNDDRPSLARSIICICRRVIAKSTLRKLTRANARNIKSK